MSGTTLLILIIIGLVAGFLGGMIGLGGAIILIPAMVLFLSMDQRMAQGTTIAIMLPPIGFFAAYNYYKAGFVNIRYALVIAVVFMLGGFGAECAGQRSKKDLCRGDGAYCRKNGAFEIGSRYHPYYR
jgi:uncharacterized protein